MSLRAGTLNRLIEVQRFTVTENDFGESEESWSTILVTNASVEPLTGKEIFQSSTLISEMTHKITMRYQEDLNTADRVVFNNRFFNITSIANVKEQNRVIEILAKEQN